MPSLAAVSQPKHCADAKLPAADAHRTMAHTNSAIPAAGAAADAAASAGFCMDAPAGSSGKGLAFFLFQPEGRTLPEGLPPEDALTPSFVVAALSLLAVVAVGFAAFALLAADAVCLAAAGAALASLPCTAALDAVTCCSVAADLADRLRAGWESSRLAVSGNAKAPVYMPSLARGWARPVLPWLAVPSAAAVSVLSFAVAVSWRASCPTSGCES